MIQNALRCWYDLTFIVAVQPTLDSRLMNYSEKWGDEAARTFAIAHSARTTARLERRFIAIAAPATQLPLLDAIALLKEEASTSS